MRSFYDNNVSVIVTAFDRRRYLNYALSSIPNNSHIETILVTNLEEEVIKNSENKIIYIYNEGKTYGRMLREGIEASKNDLIFFLEDDDIFSENKIKYIKKQFDSVKNLAYYHNSHFKIDEFGNNIGNEFKKERIFFSSFKSNRELKKVMNRNVDHNLSSIVINKEYINKNDLVTLDKINLSVDTYIFSILLKSEVILIDDNLRLTGYRIHNSTSNPDIQDSSYNPYRILHYLYYEDYKTSGSITENKYLKSFLNCKSLTEKLYYLQYEKQITLSDIEKLVHCLTYLDTTTIKNRINMFI